jgi:uncharacterized protein (DUF1778 family)
MSSPPARSTHEHLRVTPDERAIVRAAALIEGVSVSSFFRRAAAERARDTIKRSKRYEPLAVHILTPEEVRAVDLVADAIGSSRAAAVRHLLVNDGNNPFISRPGQAR